MSRRTWSEWLHARQKRSQQSRKTQRRESRQPRLEVLDERLTPAINAILSFGTLTVIGDAQDNTINVSRDTSGNLLVNGGAVNILGGVATVQNTSQVLVMGADGNDTISLNDSNGPLPKATLYGGNGNDVLIGSSAPDILFGQGGNDTLEGKGGNDSLFGGANNDTLVGGDADDQVFGESGNDRLIWNPGDDTDLNEGGADTDTIEVNGGNAADTFIATANGTRVRFDRVSPAPFSLDIGTSESLVVNANGGDDVFTANGNLAALIKLTVDGGAGNDQITGSNGDDLLLGGDGNDVIDGQQGTDVALMGAGNDVFRWDPGDGSDTVEGQDGVDKLLFFGANISERIDISSNGGRVRFFRDVANVTMDLNSVESIEFNALGGADVISVNDISGTDLTEINLNLTGSLGGGDGAADSVILNGTSGDDVFVATGDATATRVFGMAASVNIFGAEPANDRLVINGLAGDDIIDGSGLSAGAIGFTASGGDDDDILLGGGGNDILLGGNGDDILIGGPGTDVLDGGPGDNVLIQ